MMEKLLWMQLFVFQVFSMMGTLIFVRAQTNEDLNIWSDEEDNPTTSTVEFTLRSHDDSNMSTAKPVPCTEWMGMCYLDSFSKFRTEPMRFSESDLPFGVCSHVAICCGTIERNRLVPRMLDDLILYSEFHHRKLREPHLKMLLSFGKPDFPLDEMTTMLATANTRRLFIDSAIMLLRKHGFDGIDMLCDVVEKKSRQLFNVFIQEFRTAIDMEVSKTNKSAILILISVCAVVDDITCDLKTIHTNVDHIHLKAYNYHDILANETGLNSPLYSGSTDQGPATRLNTNYSASYMKMCGIPPTKIILGLATNGRAYTLTDPRIHNLSAPVSGPGLPGMFTEIPGLLSFYEICYLTTNKRTHFVWMKEQNATYLYLGNQWVSYDDELTITAKMSWAQKNGFGGWAISEVEYDDRDNICGRGSFPILKHLFKLCPQKKTYRIP